MCAFTPLAAQEGTAAQLAGFAPPLSYDNNTSIALIVGLGGQTIAAGSGTLAEIFAGRGAGVCIEAPVVSDEDGESMTVHVDAYPAGWACDSYGEAKDSRLQLLIIITELLIIIRYCEGLSPPARLGGRGHRLWRGHGWRGQALPQRTRREDAAGLGHSVRRGRPHRRAARRWREGCRAERGRSDEGGGGGDEGGGAGAHGANRPTVRSVFLERRLERGGHTAGSGASAVACIGTVPTDRTRIGMGRRCGRSAGYRSFSAEVRRTYTRARSRFSQTLAAGSSHVGRRVARPGSCSGRLHPPRPE